MKRSKFKSYMTKAELIESAKEGLRICGAELLDAQNSLDGVLYEYRNAGSRVVQSVNTGGASL